ncbi:hypothetical protein ARGLB_085_00430 [Arthrobacter globiformis NBRC 12137]|uniref:Uncharacterized protein n=1 Tax=Arthrobacter globiformis (strain ATCC 8010 / DSM 20124 / JCM 1332 / NBRC 12137 / NCIMB 8907 / NRRL B-2979 / 168) TaxID=1077972 RepID=H0QRM4_ARTG1|nr:protealysin inhibitor emfourin [Arthrobacter globiformis]GAB15360.1 hypothetical protein ARGLB_085_00430 [Arthrobacter globiformis NBRC 12137]
MKITVERSGGIAALTRVWTVQAVTTSEKSRWQPLVEACPWDAVDDPRQAPDGQPDGQPDRFMYSIRAGQRRATLPETAVTGPWRVLVESTRTAAEESRPGGGEAGFRR